MVSAGASPVCGLEREFALARAELDLGRAQRQVERHQVAADRLQHRLELVESRLGQILIAGREHAHFRRLARPGGVRRIEPRVLDAEDVEFDFEAGHVVEAGIAEPVQHLPVEMARGERHRLAVPEIDVAQHPACLRRPGQNAEGRRIGDHQEIAAAFHLRHAEAAAGGEHREHRLVRSILGEQRRGHRAAVAHNLGGVAATICLPRRMPCWSGNDRRTTSRFFSSISRSARAAASNCSSLHRPWRSTKLLAADRLR